RAHLRFELPAALAQVHQLVRLGVAVEELVRPGGAHEAQGHVGVEQQWLAVEGGAGGGWQLGGLEVAMAERRLGVGDQRNVAQMADGLHPRRRVEVVEQGRGADKAVVADQFLRVQRPVLLAEDAVPLGGQRAQAVVKRHYKFPRTACSRSMASNRARKLPLPKPRLPWRSMISKNSVGRSSTGLEKICSR